MHTLLQDLRYGLRLLWRRPAFTIVAVLTLALGIGANTAIFSVVNAVLLRPLPYPASDELIMLSANDDGGEVGNSGFATFADWRERSRSFESMALIRMWTGVLAGEGEPEMISGLRVSADYFRMLGVSPMLGRDFKPAEDRPDARFVVMLSHGLWQRRFNADPGVLGKQVNLSDRAYTVVGVMPPEFADYQAAGFYRPAEMWAPVGYEVAQPWACRSCQHLKAFARLKTGVTLAQARSEMDAIMAGMQREHPTEYPVGDVAQIRLQDRLVGDIRPALLMLFSAVGFVLLIACANVAALMLARAGQRAGEMAVRLALGAGRWRIARQLLTECLLLTLAGAGLGLLLAGWITDVLVGLSPATMLQLQGVRLDARLLGFTLAVSLLTTLLTGLYPALQATRGDLQLTLRESGARALSGGQNRLRSLLVVAEIAMALVLLAGTGLLLRSFVRISEEKPGFEPRNLLTMMVPALGARYNEEEPVRAFYRDVIARVKSLPGVESAAIVSNLPFGDSGDRSGFHIVDKPLPNPADAPSAERYGISPDYLRTMGIPLLRGRPFSEGDSANAPFVALISETSAKRFWGDEDPIGRRIVLGSVDNPPRTIVGIVPDVSHQGLDDPPDMQVYVPHAQWTGSYMQLAVRTSVDPASLADAVRNEIRAVDAGLPVYQVATMRQLVSDSLAQRRFTLLLVGLFAAIALLLSAIGIYGVISYIVEQRTREVGIRLALGAQVSDVLRMVLGQGLKLTLWGVGAGIVTALGLTRLMSGLLYGVSATDPLTFAGVAFLLFIVALAACWVPATRATRVDPIIALRHE